MDEIIQQLVQELELAQRQKAEADQASAREATRIRNLQAAIAKLETATTTTTP